jgi:hypothetical protein
MLFRDAFASVEDYLAGVENAHGYAAKRECDSAIHSANERITEDWYGELDRNEVFASSLLSSMPEADFMQAIERTVAAQHTQAKVECSTRINSILQSRGVPYSFGRDGVFRWTGDAEVGRELVAPALAAINDARFAANVRNEFEQARRELRQGTPSGRKKAVHEAGCAVESAMKVVLHERNAPYKTGDNASTLITHLRGAGMLPAYMEPTIYSVITPRNKSGGHGGGVEPLDPGEAEASAVVASAAGAIAYLHTKL